VATRSWNRVELIGNLTRDPELRYTPQGTAVVTFSIATNRTFVTDGEKREEVDFHRVVAWNKLAELCSQLLKKGNRVFVSGRLQNRSWEGQDGQSRQTTEIVIEDMLLLTSKSGTYSSDSEYSSPEPKADVPSRQAEEMPKERDKGQGESVKVEEKKDDTNAPTGKEEIENLDDLPF
jgi:single-strand DNA-binding protein